MTYAAPRGEPVTDEPIPLWVWIVFAWAWSFVLLAVLGGYLNEWMRRRR